MDTAEETFLIKTFERTRTALLTRIQDARQAVKENQELIETIQNATHKQEWWRLKGILSNHDIETLSENSPHGLLDEPE